MAHLAANREHERAVIHIVTARTGRTLCGLDETRHRLVDVEGELYLATCQRCRSGLAQLRNKMSALPDR